MKILQNLYRRYLSLKCGLSATVRSPQMRRIEGLKHPISIEIQTHRIWVSGSDGGIPLHPRDTISVIIAGGRWPGVGVFYWQPTKGKAAESVIEGFERVQDIIRGEEEKYFSLIARAPKIVEKCLCGRKEPTMEDFIRLYDEHGIRTEIVLETLGLPENYKLCDKVFEEIRAKQSEGRNHVRAQDSN